MLKTNSTEELMCIFFRLLKSEQYIFDTFRAFYKIRMCVIYMLNALSFASDIKMGSLLKYQIGIIPTVIFVSLGFASGTNTPRV